MGCRLERAAILDRPGVLGSVLVPRRSHGRLLLNHQSQGVQRRAGLAHGHADRVPASRQRLIAGRVLGSCRCGGYRGAASRATWPSSTTDARHFDSVFSTGVEDSSAPNQILLSQSSDFITTFAHGVGCHLVGNLPTADSMVIDAPEEMHVLRGELCERNPDEWSRLRELQGTLAVD